MRGVRVISMIASAICLFSAAIHAQSGCPNLPAPFPRVVQGSNPACPGDTVVLDASDPIYATFLWDDGSTGPTRTIHLTSAGIVPIFVRGFDANGCASAGLGMNVTFAPLSDIWFHFQGSNQFCKTSTGPSITALDQGGGIRTHQWSYGTSSSGPFTPIQGATGERYQLSGSDFPSTGSYFVAVTTTPTCGPVLTRTSPISVEIVDILAPPAITAPDHLCAEGRGAIAYTSLMWDSVLWSIQHGRFIASTPSCNFGGPGQCTGFEPDGTGDVILTANVTSGACSATNSVVIPIRANDPPVINAVTCGSSGSATTNTYAPSMLWSVTHATLTSNPTDVTARFTADGTGAVGVTLTVTDSYGCSSTGTTTAVDSGSGTPVITVATPDVCPAGQDSASVNASYVYYWWDVTNGSVTNGQGTSNITFGPSAGGLPIQLRVYVRDSSGCETQSDTVNVPIRVIAPPAITVAIPDVCPMGEDTASINAAYVSYWWDVVNGYVKSGQGTSTITFSPSAGGLPIQLRVYVRDASGCETQSATVNVPIRVIAPPAITVAIPDVCPMGEDTASINASYVSYWWDVVNGYVKSGQGTSTITFSPSVGGLPIQMRVYVRDASGCETQSATVNVPIRVIPAPSINVWNADICPLGSGTADINAVYVSYFWDVTNGTVTNGQGTPVITFQASGAAPVQLRVTVHDSNGCDAQSDTVTVPIHADDPPTITASGATTFCQGGSVTLTASTASSYLWSNGATTQSIVVMQTGIYAVTTTSAGGCSATSAPVSVAVNPLPTPSITVFQQYAATVALSEAGLSIVPTSGEGNVYTFCGNTTVGLFASGGSSYLWSTGATTLLISVTQSGTYSVTATNAAGCSAIATVVININPVPPTPSITASGPLAICPTGSVTLTASPADSYLWSTGATTQSVVITTPGSYHVSETIAGCVSPQSDDVMVTYATATITPSALSICPGGSVTLTASPGASYLWSNGATTQSISVASAGDYTVTVTDAYGCAITSQAVPLTNSTLAASVTPASSNICANASVTLTAAVSGGIAPISYQWFQDGTPISSATGSTYTTSTTGVYDVVVTDNGCSATSASALVVVQSAPVSYLYLPNAFCSSTQQTVMAAPVPNATYAWSVSNGTITSQSGNNVSFIAGTSGSITIGVVVTGSNGCSWSDSRSVPIDPPLTKPTISGRARICANDVIALNALASGGSGIYSYQWYEAGQPISGATYPWYTTSGYNFYPSGTFSVVVTDSLSCSSPSSDPYTITIDPAPSLVLLDYPTNFCAGAAASVRAADNGPGATYDWSLSGGTITSTAANAVFFTPGTGTSLSLTVTITTAAGCTDRGTWTFPIHAQPLKPVITASDPTTFCRGSFVNLTASIADSYLWSDGQTTRTIGAAQSGSYTVTATTAGCSATSDPVIVTVNDYPPTPVITASGPTTFCAGGSVTLTAPSAASYAWSNGASTQAITVNTSGSYTVRVTNAAGCSATSAPTTVTVNAAPPTPVITPWGPTTFCTGGDVLLVASDATSYLWSNGATAQFIRVNTPGSYTVMVTNANGCSATSAPVTVTVNALPATPVITASGPTTFCAGGSVTLTASSATSYYWSTGERTQSITVNVSGSYAVMVTNAGGCSATSAPTTVTVNAAPPSPVITASGPTTFCAGGSVTLTAPSATSYLWSNGSTTQSITVSASGSYSVAVTNANGCSATSAATVVTANALPTPTITASGPTTFCAGGSVTLTSSAGASYLWSNGATTQSIVVNAPGSYSVAVTDANGCSAGSAPTAVTVNPLPVIVTNGSGGNVCTGVEAAAEIQPIADVTYAWSFFGNGHITQSAGHRVYFIVDSGTATLTVIVTDANGCSSSASKTYTANPPVKPVVSAGGPTAFCAGGSVTLTSTPGYTYTWSNGATTQSIAVTQSGSYTVTVLDLNGCTATSDPVNVTVYPAATTPIITASGPTNLCAGGSVTLTATATAASSYVWSTGATTQSITVSTPGSYSVTATDANGCSASSAPTVVTVNPLPAPTIMASGPTTFCAGGSVTLTASAALSYLWSTGATTQSIIVNSSGSYSVTATNANGCSASSAPTAVTVNPLPPSTISASGPTTFCAGASVTLTASSGSSYLWSNGATTQSIVVNTSGNYSVTVTNANGCSATSTATAVVTNPLPPPPTITASGPTTFCNGGSVTLTASEAPLYLWSNGATTRAITVNASGAYSVTVTDANACSATSAATTVTVNPPNPVITASGSTDICPGTSVTLTAPSGYTYLWSNGARTQSVNVNQAGNYTVTIKDAGGCSATSAPTTVTLKTKTSIKQPSNQSIHLNQTTTLTVVASGTNLHYQWYSGRKGDVSTPLGTEVSQSVGPYSVKDTYYFWVRVAGDCGTVDSNTINVTVN